MLKSDRLVCEKNATKAQPVTNCNLGSINYIYFNYKVNLLIDREKIFVTRCLEQSTPLYLKNARIFFFFSNCMMIRFFQVGQNHVRINLFPLLFGQGKCSNRAVVFILPVFHLSAPFPQSKSD